MEISFAHVHPGEQLFSMHLSALSPTIMSFLTSQRETSWPFNSNVSGQTWKNGHGVESGVGREKQRTGKQGSDCF